MALRVTFTILFNLLVMVGLGQYDWKLAINNNGIKVYKSDVPHRVFKAIKVECTLEGTYSKLVSILTNVAEFNTWIYHTKTSKLLQQTNPLDLVYYAETYLPWPIVNRDLLIHLKISSDSLPSVLNISGSIGPNLVPKKAGKVRVNHYMAKWRVTMPSPGKLKIFYILEIDPGGGMPAWAANAFAAKGPYETFLSLSKKLKQ